MTEHTELGGPGWTVTCLATDSTGNVPGRAAAVFGSVPATVPGCVHTDLMAAGLLDDPYLGRNEAAQSWVGDQTWRYTRVFELAADAAELSREHVELVFEGLDTVAVVVLDGVELARTYNQHRTYRFDVRQFLHEGSNTLEVTFLPALAYAIEQDALLGHRPDSAEVHPYNAIRKMACNFGWDWGPALITCGIWRAVRLESWDVRIETATMLAGLDGTTGALRVNLALSGEVSGAEVVVRVAGRQSELVATPEPVSTGGRRSERRQMGAMGSREREGIPGSLLSGTGDASGHSWGRAVGADRWIRAECVASLEVPGVEPWWPHSMGAQPLYEVTVELRRDGRLLDRLRRRVGFRTVTLDTTPDADGGGAPFALSVNGVELFVRGANWIPDDCFPSRIDAARYSERVAQAVEANIDLLRVWGGGIYESDDFYDACDASGVLVWQDLLLACAAYAEEQPLYGEFEAEARDNVTRLAHHPSLALWNGGNENLWGFDSWGWDAKLKGATWGAGYYYDLFPEVVAELDGTRPYVTGSPTSGNPAIHANNANYQTMHLWDVWNTDDYVNYSQHSPRFASEFGFQGPATWATWARAVDAAERSSDSPTMLAHQKAAGGNDKLTRGLVRHLPLPGTGVEDFDDWLYLTQLNQARAVRYGIEWWRSMRGRCMGAIVWQLNDCWPVTSWAALDSGTDAQGRPVARRKPLWYALRSVYADRLLTVQPGPRSGWQVVAVNDGTEVWQCEVRARVRALDGSVTESVELPVRVPPRSKAAIELPFSVRRGDRVALVAEAAGAERCVRPLAEDISLGLPAASYDTQVTREPGRTTVRVDARTFCRSVCLFVDRVAENLHADSMLVDLFPGESHEFVVEGDLSAVGDDELVATLRTVRVEA